MHTKKGLNATQGKTRRKGEQNEKVQAKREQKRPHAHLQPTPRLFYLFFILYSLQIKIKV